MKMFFSRLSVLFYATVLSIVCAGSATAAPIVMAGSDYFKTLDGTFFDFDEVNLSLSLGNIAFEGVPNGPGGSDTQVNRLQDADLTLADSTPGEDIIDIELVALSLKSIDILTIGGNTGNIFVELNTSDPSKNKGTMTITGDSSAGAFDSIFNVFVDIIIGDNIANGIVLANGVDLGDYESNGAQWVESGRLLLATGEIVHILPNPAHGMHIVEQIVEQIPEPSSLLLLSLGLLPLAYRRSNKSKN